MRQFPIIAAAFILAFAGSAGAQPAGHSGHGDQASRGGHESGRGHGAAGPYAGWHKRAVKSLSEEEMADLRAGRGMALALSAELNGYPGPVHVLELAEDLNLTPEQRAATEAMLAEMKAAAAERGAELIRAERAVDAQFTGAPTTEADLGRAVDRAAVARARLRVVHLRYHLRMKEMLTPAQVATYNRIRGYI